jgi:hypothetical protein
VSRSAKAFEARGSAADRASDAAGALDASRGGRRLAAQRRTAAPQSTAPLDSVPCFLIATVAVRVRELPVIRCPCAAVFFPLNMVKRY